MNTDNTQLSRLLRESRATPALPPRFQQNVWRRIEEAEASAVGASWLDALATLFLRPRFALAGISVLLVAGILVGSLDGQKRARQEARLNYLASVAPHSAR